SPARVAGNVTRWTFAADGSVWVLQANGDLSASGVKVMGGVKSFSFDAQNRVLVLSTANDLSRSNQPYGAGGLLELGRNVVKAEPQNGAWWVLQADGNLLVDGVPTWSDKADFHFDGQHRALLLGTATAGGMLSRSKQAYGAGGWDVLATGVQ